MPKCPGYAPDKISKHEAWLYLWSQIHCIIHDVSPFFSPLTSTLWFFFPSNRDDSELMLFPYALFRNVGYNYVRLKVQFVVCLIVSTHPCFMHYVQGFLSTQSITKHHCSEQSIFDTCCLSCQSQSAHLSSEILFGIRPDEIAMINSSCKEPSTCKAITHVFCSGTWSVLCWAPSEIFPSCWSRDD